MSATKADRSRLRREAAAVPTPAKLNLRLVVLARENTGYHQIETLLIAIALSDQVRVERGGGDLVLETRGYEAGPIERNLAYRAALVFFAETGIEAQAVVELDKRIPVAAGLGGGSSDAAATLRVLNQLYGEPLRQDRLLGLAAKLGSDVAFFLSSSSMALAWGRGERLLALPAPPPASVLVAVAGPRIPTADAYDWLASSRLGVTRDTPGIEVQVGLLRDWAELARLAGNDFETVILPRYPHLDRLKRDIQETDPQLALLTGSGSALFAIYRNEQELEAAHESLGRRFPGIMFIPTRTLTEMPRVQPA